MAAGLRAVPRAQPPLRWAVITLRAARIRPHTLNQSHRPPPSSLPSLQIALGGQALTGSRLGAGGGQPAAAPGTPTHHDPRLVGRQRVDGQAAPHQVLADAGPLGPRRGLPSSPPPFACRWAPRGASWGGHRDGSVGSHTGRAPTCGLGSALSPRQGSFCSGDTSLGGLSVGKQHHRDDGDAWKGFSGQGWLQGAGTGDRHPWPGEESRDGGVKGGRTPINTPHTPPQLSSRHCEAPGMGKMRLQQRSTSVAVSSMSPAIGPSLRAGLGSGRQGRPQASISKSNASLVPSLAASLPAQLQPREGAEAKNTAQHLGVGVGGNG